MKQKFAGLPMYVWLGAAAALGLAFWIMKRRNAQAAVEAGPIGFTSTGPTPIFDNTGGDLTPNPAEDKITPLPTTGGTNYLGPPIPDTGGDKGNHQGGGGGARTGGGSGGPTGAAKTGTQQSPQRFGTSNALGNARPSLGGTEAAPLPGTWFTAHLETAGDSVPGGRGGF